MRLRSFALLAALVAIAMGLVAVGTPMKVAQADDPPVFTAGQLVVHKHCLPPESVATFTVLLDFQFTALVGDLPPVTTGDDPDPNTAFDVTFMISCGDGESDGADDGDTVTFMDGGGDFDLADLFDWYETNINAIASGTAEVTEEPVPGVTTLYASNFGPEGECSWDETQIENFATTGIYCLITNDLAALGDPNITVTKVFEGEPADQLFTFTLLTDAVDGCAISIDGGPLGTIMTGETFDLMNGQTASITCPPGVHSVGETPAEGIPLTALDCTFAPEDAGTTNFEDSSFTVTIGTGITTADCTFTNGGEEDTPGIIVKKECVGIEGTFTFEVGGAATELSEDIACGESFEFGPLEPGTYTIDELIDEATGGDDGEDPCDTSCNTCDPCGDQEDGGIVTMIACSDLQQVDGTSVTVELVDVDIFCVFINSDEDLSDVACGCLDIEIDLDNTNTNTIGIDNSNTNNNANDNDNLNDNNNENKNENNNENTNEQNQENTQDQTNDNSQTNNIDSSPEVNIDFGNR